MIAFLKTLKQGSAMTKIASLMIGLGIAALITGTYRSAPRYVAPSEGIPSSLRVAEGCFDISLHATGCRDDVQTAY